MTYTLTPADHAFTLWLATRNRRRVMAEQHVRFTPVEKQMIRYHAPKRVKAVKPPSVPKRVFSRAEIDIALAVLAAQKLAKESKK